MLTEQSITIDGSALLMPSLEITALVEDMDKGFESRLNATSCRLDDKNWEGFAVWYSNPSDKKGLYAVVTYRKNPTLTFNDSSSFPPKEGDFWSMESYSWKQDTMSGGNRLAVRTVHSPFYILPAGGGNLYNNAVREAVLENCSESGKTRFQVTLTNPQWEGALKCRLSNLYPTDSSFGDYPTIVFEVPRVRTVGVSNGNRFEIEIPQINPNTRFFVDPWIPNIAPSMVWPNK